MKKMILNVKGMHCSSCNILINNKFKHLKNVKNVKSDFRSQRVEVLYEGSLSIEKLNRLIKPFGYEIGKNTSQDSEDYIERKKHLIDFIFLLVFFSVVFLIAQEINFLPNFSYTDLSLPMVFFLGLVASVSTCMATAGALYLAISKKNTHLTTAISFSVGRVVAYGFFGFIFGFLGKTLVTSVFFAGLLTLLVGLMMIFLGLDLAYVFSWQRFIGLSYSGRIFEFFEEKLSRYPRRLPFLFGAITYFLPCGFTHSIQLYSMSSANPIFSSLNMIVFAIGTIPLILLINQAKQIRLMNFYHYFVKIAGVLVFLVGVSYIFNFTSLFGINPLDRIFTKNINEKLSPVLVNGKQEIRMVVNNYGYDPDYFQVKRGIPVKWIIDGQDVFGCQGYFVVPKLKISQTLKPGETVFEFTPKETEIINFSCGMGMYRGMIEIKE